MVPNLPVAPTEWRRLNDEGGRVLFAAGSAETMLQFVWAVPQGDTWVAEEGGAGGPCTNVPLAAPDGLTYASWGVDLAYPPQPEDEQVRVVIPDAGSCPDTLQLDDVVGQQVIETDTAITIRVAIRRAAHAPPEPPVPQCSHYRRPIMIAVPLARAVGERAILDGNWFPARTVPLRPQPAPGPREPKPVIAVDGGGIEMELRVAVNDGGQCASVNGGSPGCSDAPRQALVEIRSGNRIASGLTSALGQATLVVDTPRPAVKVTGPDLWCGNFTLPEMGPGPRFVAVSCVRLDRPHGRIHGRIPGLGSGASVSLRRGDRFDRYVMNGVNGDGSFDAILEPGTWYVDFADTPSTPCTGTSTAKVVITGGGDHEVVPKCPPL